MGKNFFLFFFLIIALLYVVVNCSESGSHHEDPDKEDEKKLLNKDIITRYDSTGAKSRITTIVYDRDGKLSSHEFIDLNTSDNNCNTSYSYDSYGRKNSIKWNYYNKGCVLIDSYTYVTDNNKQTITKVTTNDADQITDTNIKEYENGKLLKETSIDNEAGNDNSTKDYFYDAEGKIIRLEHKHLDGDTGDIVNDTVDIYVYDIRGRNITITSYDSDTNDKIEIITYEYDSYDRKVSEKSEYIPVPEDNYLKYYYYNDKSFIYKIKAEFPFEPDSDYIEIHNYIYY